ncbi:MAG TPA: AMP-binding protein [Fimbriimonadaceae bacterium]|nr:AMP-binding protein [Fimbriimonadaceae bacterium]
MSPIDFESAANAILLNPRIPSEQAESLRARLTAAGHLAGHIFILTSGSSSDPKWVALSKQAILASAEAANGHLESTSSDIWLHSLPDFHVGGIGIRARAHLSGAKLVEHGPDRWNANAFHEVLEASRATLTSLVPTQVHDLVQAGLRSPNPLRAIVVGGAALSESTYQTARALGWPLLPSYGLTEAASQVATAPLDSLAKLNYPPLTLLPHLEARIGRNCGRIKLRGPSLLTGYIDADEGGEPRFTNPKTDDGWFTTEDLGELNRRDLTPIGRVQDRIKIGGELANLAALRRTLEEEAMNLRIDQHVALIAEPDSRLESAIALVIEAAQAHHTDTLKAAFDANVLPYERIRRVHFVDELPRTELGKVKWSAFAALGPEP